MSIAHLLESFDPARTGGPSISMSELSLEEQKLEAFERGYKAGWDDAEKARVNETAKFSSEFGNNLRELSFTYHEAYGHMVKSLKPLLTQVVDTLLPEIARKTLGPQIAEQLTELAQAEGGSAVEIVVAPGNASMVNGFATTIEGFPIRVVEEPSLGEGQAYLRFGEAEREIDHGAVLSGITRAVDAFFHEIDQSTEKEAEHAG